MTSYVRVRWYHEGAEYAVLFLSELNDDRYEHLHRGQHHNSHATRIEVRTVHIVNVQAIEGTSNEVTFSSSIGQAWGHWHGDLPADGSAHVEIDIPEPVTTWQPADRPADALVGRPRSVVTICALVESVDDDGVVALRLASDIVLVDWEAVVPPPVGERIILTTATVELYPYTI
ncbi:hypothetical protein ACFWJT_25880 [Streptomyces sp. NPDC127069]|uniref:hypothetical protein n=1 Tax=Streptomyces sp. NPDC127069 TaxID=3347128 RepID=UPI00364AF824